jgi:hypothetical protein
MGNSEDIESRGHKQPDKKKHMHDKKQRTMEMNHEIGKQCMLYNTLIEPEKNHDVKLFYLTNLEI